MVCGRLTVWRSAGGFRLAVCVWRFIAGVLRAFCRRFAGGLRAVCVWQFKDSLRPVCGRFADSLRAECGWRFAVGSRVVCGRFAAGFICGGIRLSVCVWRFALVSLRLAVRVWRFAGGFLAVLQAVYGWQFAVGLLLVVCGRFASGKPAVVGRFAVGGLRLRLTKYTPRDNHNATPNPIKLRIAQRWTSRLDSILDIWIICILV